MNILNKIFNQKPRTYIVSVCLFLIVTIIYLGVNGFRLLINYVNAFTIAGFVDIFIGGLILVTKLGAFNTIGYGFARILGNRKKYEDLYDYNERKSSSYRGSYSFLIFFFIGLIGIIISVILMAFL